MLCPKCGEENLGNIEICFFCGQELPTDDNIYIALEKDPVQRWRPKYVDIHLPKDEGSLRISFLKPPYKDGNRIRVRHKGHDGRFRGVSDLSSLKVVDMIKDIIGAINKI